jgi:hypothetical protein
MMTVHVAWMGIVIVALLSATSVFARPCLTAHPAPTCRSCFVTECGYVFQLTPPMTLRSIQTVGDSITYEYAYELMGRHVMTSELGYIININETYGLGFTHFIGWNFGSNLRGGLKLRMRKWLNPKTSVDVSAGAILWGMNRSGLKDPTPVGSVSVTFSEWESVNLLVEVVEARGYDYAVDYGDGIPRRNILLPQRNVGVQLGYKLSSKPGLFVNAGAVAVTGILTVVFLAALSGQN